MCRLIDMEFSRDTTENVSTVFRVTKLWTRCYTVTGLITKYTVEVNANDYSCDDIAHRVHPVSIA